MNILKQPLILLRGIIMILSRDNKNIKLAMKLKNKKYREAEGKFLIEGIRFVEEAINENVVEFLLFSQKLYTNNDFDRVMENACVKYEVEDSVLKELTETETPQGIMAVVKKKNYRLQEVTDGMIIIADGVQDPGNLGTIIRTCDAAGAAAVVLAKGTVDVYNDKVLRATMGSIFHIPVIQAEDFKQLIEELQIKNFKIYATSLEGSENIYTTRFGERAAVIIGNEANGISEEHLELADKKIKIPMPGRAESLNAATAASIITYEILRQNGKY